MKKSWMIFLVGTLLAAGGLAMSARAQNNNVYAVEFNTGDNGFGIINLMNGTFTEISDLGGATYNDIAYAPNGTLYGLYNNGSSLVTFDPTTGAVNPGATLSVPGIESIAFRPSDGALFGVGLSVIGAPQNGLYTIDPTTGETTLVGSFGDAYNLYNPYPQNIRFDSDGQLYLSNTSDNTDIYRVSTDDGSATFVGEVEGYSDLILENGGQYMYGVSIPSINGANALPVLVSFDLNSFVDGGTNADGSIHQISVTMVGAGGDFPINFNFSGNVPNPLPANIPDASTVSIAIQDGNPAITLSGSTNQTYVLQASVDMHNWTSISTNLTDANGLFTFVDTDAKNYPSRFYRGVAPAQLNHESIKTGFYMNGTSTYDTTQRHAGGIEIDDAPARGPLPPLKKKRSVHILCIDDDAQVREFMTQCLTHFNHRVTVASGGRRGLEMFRAATQENQPYEVVITDLGMPDIDGQRVTRTIKAESPNTPVIMMTGWGTFMEDEGETALPVDAVVGKPPRMQELNDLILRMATPAA